MYFYEIAHGQRATMWMPTTHCVKSINENVAKCNLFLIHRHWQGNLVDFRTIRQMESVHMQITSTCTGRLLEFCPIQITTAKMLSVDY